ncbi:hypothetical protein Tco_0733884 [Tanacetum coccineum]
MANAEQAPARASPVRTDEQIVPRNQWVPIGKSNCYLNEEKSQRNPIFKIAVDILKQTNFFRAFTASSTIPAIYIQQFWDTIRFDSKARSYRCQLDEQWRTRYLLKPGIWRHLWTGSVEDEESLRYNVRKPLPLGGWSRPALSISKMKATYYPDVGLEQLVPDQFWIEEECKYDIATMYGISHWWFQRQRFYIDRFSSEGDRRAVGPHGSGGSSKDGDGDTCSIRAMRAAAPIPSTLGSAPLGVSWVLYDVKLAPMGAA